MPEIQPAVSVWPAAKVRDTFISFFEGKGHVKWVSSPVVPLNDPTLLFTNAGLFFFLSFLFGCSENFRKVEVVCVYVYLYICIYACRYFLGSGFIELDSEMVSKRRWAGLKEDGQD